MDDTAPCNPIPAILRFFRKNFLSSYIYIFTARLNQALQTILASSASPVERAVALRLVEGLVALRLSLLRPAEAACARADRQAGCCCACAQPEARCAEGYGVPIA